MLLLHGTGRDSDGSVRRFLDVVGGLFARVLIGSVPVQASANETQNFRSSILDVSKVEKVASVEGRISAGREVAGSLEVVAAGTCSAQEFVG